MDPILIKALESLTITSNIAALHASDEDTIKVTLKTLHKNDVGLPPQLIENWLLANKWQPNPIKCVVQWASTIGSGGSVRLKFKDRAPKEKEVWARLNA
ncbi:hypothetical protein [Rheinheimera sp.]|uniref:hypothetical protein n=1 Tax=Rheinheimera sp. TaxID=1869214 RepID=UPI00307EE707